MRFPAATRLSRCSSWCWRGGSIAASSGGCFPSPRRWSRRGAGNSLGEPKQIPRLALLARDKQGQERALKIPVLERPCLGLRRRRGLGLRELRSLRLFRRQRLVLGLLEHLVHLDPVDALPEQAVDEGLLGQEVGRDVP